MSSKIRVLSDHTINKIAAGEVIENPASVVKELVENSLDAGATDICIEIQGGGRQLIRISDNGCGMSPDDTLLCLERHATSKIREVEEIHDITTMGFRGEAIPSIASISKFTLLSCPQNEKVNSDSIGTMVIVDGGKVISCNPAARSQGTTIEVKSLFFNVPVRKKFLKSPAVDANEILKTVSLMSLGYPTVKFQLINDGKSALMCTASQETSFEEHLKARIGQVLGQDYLSHTQFFEEQTDFCKIQGVAGLPNYTRHNRTGQYLFINQRGVTSPIVSFAVRDGYGTSLPSGRHPVFVLHLTLDGELVDVNVHPQKREVRLRQEQLIRGLIVNAIGKVLRHDTSFINAANTETTISPVFAGRFNEPEIASPSPTRSDTWVFKPKHTLSPQPESPKVNYLQSIPQPPPIPQPPASKQSSFDYHQVLNPSPATTVSLPLPPKQHLPPKVLAIISRFILLDAVGSEDFIKNGSSMQNKGGLIVVSQKAAHSRIIYEKLMNNEPTNSLAHQALLIPHPIEVAPFEAEALRKSLPLLNQMGLHIQEFGPSSFIINAIPQIFGNANLDILIKDIIHGLRENGENHLEQEKTKLIALTASRAAVCHDRRLTIEEAQGILDQLVKCKQPYICPMGKPTLVQMTTDELAKLF